MTRAFKINSYKHGFTLIELVIVLIVMSIVAVFIASRASTSGNELIAETDTLKSHLRYAQIRAMNDSVPWGIYIPNASSYVLYRNNEVEASQMLPGEKPGAATAPQTHNLQGTVTITSGAGTTYNFNAWGAPVNMGIPPIPLATAQTITLSEGAATSSITITKNTGHVP